jgi:hypothetical protein
MGSSSRRTDGAVAATFAASLAFTALALWTAKPPPLIGFSSVPLSSLPYFWYLLAASGTGFIAGILGFRSAFSARRPTAGGLIGLAIVWVGLLLLSFALCAEALWLLAVLLAPGHATGVLGATLWLREALRQRTLARFERANQGQS